MNKWNIIAPLNYINIIKKSKYYKNDLGKSLTVIDERKNGERELRENEFTTWYYNNNNSLLFKSGSIGQLHFYIDYYLREQIVGFFKDDELEKHQYAVEWDIKYINKFGIDKWLGEKLKEIDSMVNNNIEEISNNKNINKKGDMDKLFNSPGSVRWEDIKDYYNKKKKINK